MQYRGDAAYKLVVVEDQMAKLGQFPQALGDGSMPMIIAISRTLRRVGETPAPLNSPNKLKELLPDPIETDTRVCSSVEVSVNGLHICRLWWMDEHVLISVDLNAVEKEG